MIGAVGDPQIMIVGILGRSGGASQGSLGASNRAPDQAARWRRRACPATRKDGPVAGRDNVVLPGPVPEECDGLSWASTPSASPTTRTPKRHQTKSAIAMIPPVLAQTRNCNSSGGIRHRSRAGALGSPTVTRPARRPGDPWTRRVAPRLPVMSPCTSSSSSRRIRRLRLESRTLTAVIREDRTTRSATVRAGVVTGMPSTTVVSPARAPVGASAPADQLSGAVSPAGRGG